MKRLVALALSTVLLLSGCALFQSEPLTVDQRVSLARSLSKTATTLALSQITNETTQAEVAEVLRDGSLYIGAAITAIIDGESDQIVTLETLQVLFGTIDEISEDPRINALAESLVEILLTHMDLDVIADAATDHVGVDNLRVVRGALEGIYAASIPFVPAG